MKKLILISFLFTLSTSFAQQDLINYLFEIKYNYKTFNLKGKVKQLNSRTGMSNKGGMGLLSNKHHRCLFNRKGNLTYVTYFKSHHVDDNRNNETYKYDKQHNLSEINKVENYKPIENYYFFYNKNGNLKSVIVTDVKRQSATNYFIEWNKNQPTKITIEDTNKKIIYTSNNHQFDKNNNIIQFNFNESGDLGKATRKYDDNNNLIFENYEFINDSTFSFEILTTYNDDNNITSKTEDAKTIKYIYKEFDVHDNWKYLKHFIYLEFREFIYY